MRDLPTDKIISCFYGSSDDCIKVIDTSGTLMSFNPNGLRVMEIDDEKSVIGREWLTFWDESMLPKAAAALEKAKHGELAKFEGYCPTFKGTMKYWEVSIAPLYDGVGGVAWLLVISREATREKELERTVAALSKRIKALESQLEMQYL